MEQPPPRRRSDTLRRSPRSRHEDDSRVRGFVHTAFAAGVGDDIGALTSTSPRSRYQLNGIALRLVVIVVVVAALVVAVSVFSNRPTEAIAIPTPDQIPTGQIEDPELLNGEDHASGSMRGDQEPGDASQVPEFESGPKVGSPSGGAPPDGEPSQPRELVIHISGAVAQGGVVTVPAGSRINDVVQEAGGLAPEADTARINLAAKVTDGDHIHIVAIGEEAPFVMDGGVGSAGGVGSHGTPDDSLNLGSGSGNKIGVVDINSANATELETVPGIGPVTAQAIISWRETHGPFNSVDQLVQVDGIGTKTLDRLRPHVTV